MTDTSKTYLVTLGEEITRINQSKGWNLTIPENWEDPYKIPAVLMLIVSEVSEALEAFRKDDKENFREELADVAIRLLDLCTGLKIDIDSEIQLKLEKNRAREYRHGGKKV